MSADERRDGIIDAATVEFARSGYQGATIARIATAARCSEPNLYKHFRDKRELLIACLERTEARAEAALDTLVHAPDRFIRLMEIVDTSTDYRQMLQLRMLCSTLPDDVELLAHLRDGTGRLVARFSAGIERGKAEGTVHADVNAHHVAWSWLGISLAACYSMALGGEHRFADVMGVGKRILSEALVPAPE